MWGFRNTQRNSSRFDVNLLLKKQKNRQHVKYRPLRLLMQMPMPNEHRKPHKRVGNSMEIKPIIRLKQTLCRIHQWIKQMNGCLVPQIMLMEGRDMEFIQV